MSDAVENLDTRELGFSDAEDEPEEVDFKEFNPSGKCYIEKRPFIVDAHQVIEFIILTGTRKELSLFDHTCVIRVRERDTQSLNVMTPRHVAACSLSSHTHLEHSHTQKHVFSGMLELPCHVFQVMSRSLSQLCTEQSALKRQKPRCTSPLLL